MRIRTQASNQLTKKKGFQLVDMRKGAESTGVRTFLSVRCLLSHDPCDLLAAVKILLKHHARYCVPQSADYANFLVSK